LPPIDFRQMGLETLAPYRQFVLARDYVRYVGEPVAVVFATDPYVAEDAADLVFCDVFVMTGAKIRHLTSYLMELPTSP